MKFANKQKKMIRNKIKYAARSGNITRVNKNKGGGGKKSQ